MQFSDKGIIINQKKYGENSLIVKIFSHNHGFYSGFVKRVKSAKEKVIFQVGNLVTFEFRNRIEENLGQFLAVDLARSYGTKIIFDKLRLNCVSSLFSIMNNGFLERENHCDLFEKLQIFLEEICDEETAEKMLLSSYIKLELKILKTLGYGIDLTSCVATNSTTNLAFVSPKSARAVCFEAGRPYQNKLLKLPNFLTKEDAEIEKQDLLDGLRLSGFFLEKFIFENGQEKFQNRQNLERFLT